MPASRPNLLYLVHRVPCPPNRGDRIRSYHMLRYLAERADVHLACLADEPVSSETLSSLSKWCATVQVVALNKFSRWLNAACAITRGETATEGLFYSRHLQKVVARLGREVRFDGVLVFCSSMAQYLAAVETQNLPVVVDLVDIDSQKWFDYAHHAQGPARWLFELEGRRLQRLESALAARATAVTAVSRAEIDLLLESCPDAPGQAITNGVDLSYFRPQNAACDHSRCELVFVGALDYRANIDGVMWFCSHVWPALTRALPAARLTLVGRKPTSAVKRLASMAGVEIAADVPDVRPYLSRATMVIAPLRIARGVQNKVLEALAMAKCVVATPQAIAGLQLSPDVNIWQADAPAEWIEGVRRLSADYALRSRLGVAGRSFVETHHRWSTCLQPLGTLLRLTVAEPREHLALS